VTAALTLYVEELWDSPFVFTAFVALHEKGLAFDTRVLHLAKNEHEQPGFAEKFVLGRVPALEHGEFCLGESLAIVEYLDEAFPGPSLLPKEPRDRARARMVLMWLRTDLGKLREERPTTTMFFEPTKAPLTAAGLAAKERLVSIATRLLSHGREHLFDVFTIADADLSFMLHRLLANGDAIPELLRAYAERIWRRPSVQAFVKQPRPALTAA
jgi:glutathione S-transferase